MAGHLNPAQTRAIVESLDALPDLTTDLGADLGAHLVAKAEAFLVQQAADLGPRELRHLGRGVLTNLAPEIADETDRRRLEAE